MRYRRSEVVLRRIKRSELRPCPDDLRRLQGQRSTLPALQYPQNLRKEPGEQDGRRPARVTT